jgi:hypothetical protein
LAEDLIIARFQADITDYRSKLLQLESELNKLSDTEKKTAEDQKKVSNELATASQKRTAALKNEEAELKRLQVALKQAFTAPEINKINGQINSVKNNIAALKGETSGLGKVLGGLGGQFAEIGAGVAAAFSVQAVIQFASASIDAFLEADSNAQRLKNSLNEIGQEGQQAFSTLIKQSEELAQAGKTIFTDDDIQRAQAQLANYGLTAIEIEKLIPKLADYASATQQNIVDASAKAGNALLGQGKEFKKYGIVVSATATSTENFNSILDGLGQFQGRAAKETETLIGQLASQKREVEELQEALGSRLAPAYVAVKKTLLSFLLTITGGNGSLDQRLKSLKTTAEEASLILGNTSGNIKDESLKKYIELSKSINELDKALKNSNGSKEEFNKSVNELAEKQSLLNTKTDEGISLFRIYTEGIRKLTDTYKELNPTIQSTIDLSKKSTEELLKLKEASGDDRDLIILIDRELAARKKLEDAANKASEAAKKAQEEINKLSEENLKNQESLRQQFVKSQQDSLDVELKNKLVALSELQLADEDYAKERLLLEIDTQKKIIEIDSLSFDEKQKAIEKLQDLQINFNDLISANNQKRSEEDQKAANDLADSIAASWQKLEDDKTAATKKGAEDREELEKLAIQKTFDLANQLASAIFQISSDNLRRTQEEETQALQTSKDNALSNKRLTEGEKDRINKEFAAKELALKKKQFEENKKQARSEAVIKGALAIINALATANNIYAGLILAAAIAAETAIEIGVINSQKFAKGTKKAKGGMATVGEEGPEFMYVPNEAKILTAKQTRQHSRLIDAMYDGHLDKIIHQDYILPALQKQKAGYEKKKEQTFSNNLAKSLIFNGLTGNEMERIRKRGTDINNIDELVEKLASVIQTKNNPRRF